MSGTMKDRPLLPLLIVAVTLTVLGAGLRLVVAFWPVERGGTNEARNLVTCCLSCNSGKQGLSARAWYAKLRARGLDVPAVQRRIRRLTRRALDRAVGRRLARERQLTSPVRA